MKESQTKRLYALLSNYLPHRTDEIVDKIYGHGLSLARVGARVWDCKKQFGAEINGKKDEENPALYWYTMKPKLYHPIYTLPPARLPKSKEPAKLL